MPWKFSQNSINKEMKVSKRQQTLKINLRNQHMNRKVGEAMTHDIEKRIRKFFSPFRNKNV